jgi:sulfate adenylyltransferase
MRNYYMRERVVLTILQAEMRYAGPREAIHHAIVRKNFGCTHFIVGRDHAGVEEFYPPYAAQEIFDRFPDLGIVPLFFTAVFYCQRCGSIANEKVCPHDPRDRVQFSGTTLRRLIRGDGEPLHLVRPEVLEVIRTFDQPLVVA